MALVLMVILQTEIAGNKNFPEIGGGGGSIEMESHVLYPEHQGTD